MKFVKRKRSLAVVAVLGIGITTFCIEYLSYIHNSGSWRGAIKGEGDDDDNDDDAPVARILLVADPQIIGENNENWLWGWVARWDADRYLEKTYQMAKRHVSPNVVVFLGDLFDEGSTADDPEYRRYFQRFANIFQLPSNKNPSVIKHIFVPGDNDVGGEKTEPVDSVKVSWFTKVFGDLRSVLSLSEKGMEVQFLKMNLFMPTEYKDPVRGLQHVINNGTKKPDIRLIVSHISLLSFQTNSVEKVLEAFQPNLIIAAHSHKSAYLKRSPSGQGQKKAVHIIHDFLITGKAQYLTSHLSTDPSSLERDPLLTQSSLRLDLKASGGGGGGDVHEILVPTCSYRMGVPHMGYGAMQIYKNGTMDYTVLWLPSRFNQLYLYIVIYVLAKIIITPWVLWKGFSFLYRKWFEWRRGGHFVKLV